MPIHSSLSFRHSGQKTAVLKESPWPYRDVGELIALKNCIFDILLFCRFLLRPYGLPDLISFLMIPRFVHLSLPWSLQREGQPYMCPCTFRLAGFCRLVGVFLGDFFSSEMSFAYPS